MTGEKQRLRELVPLPWPRADAHTLLPTKTPASVEAVLSADQAPSHECQENPSSEFLSRVIINHSS